MVEQLECCRSKSGKHRHWCDKPGIHEPKPDLTKFALAGQISGKARDFGSALTKDNADVKNVAESTEEYIRKSK